MTTLVLLRHAKAIASDPGGDHARDLSGRGRDTATAVGARLRTLDPPIDLALVSDAIRTRQTADLALKAWPRAVRIQIEPDLYAATPDDILAILKKVEPKFATVLVIGHNPGLGEVARRLCSPGERTATPSLRDGFPTAAVAVIDFGAMPWAEVHAEVGTLTQFIVPEPEE